MKRRRLAAMLGTLLLTAAMLAPTATAQIPGERIPLWWQYDPSVWRHGWPDHPELVAAHTKWHEEHPNATAAEHKEFHEKLQARHREMHFHEAADAEAGEATWYDADGGTGACGNELHGMYVAHKTWPCGSLVSVRINGRYVFVTVEDRGPFGEGRIVDLSKKAFSKLADPSVGVLQVRATLLDP